MGMVDQGNQEDIVRKKLKQDEDLKKLQKAKSGGVHGIAKAQKEANASKQALAKAVSKEARMAESSRAMQASKDASSFKGMTTGGKIQAGASIASAVLGASGGGEEGGGAGSGALSGLMAGASTGNPYAAVAGAVIGGITGGLKARSARKKAQAEAEAQTQEGLAKISQDKAERLRQSFSSLGSAMSAGLRQTNFVNF